MCPKKNTQITPIQIPQNESFIGRDYEKRRLSEILDKPGPRILIVYGRRRIGKTELLEQFFRNRSILKFEGLESGDDSVQKQAFLTQLASYCSPDAAQPLTRLSSNSSWMDIFIELSKFTSESSWTIYLEEIQWLATDNGQFISDLKYVWDNHFSRNKNILFILCGSAPSFMVDKVIMSKALYGRSTDEIPMKPFSLPETHEFLSGKLSKESIFDLYLTLGGILEYLKHFKGRGSSIEILARESFTPGGAFVQEFNKIFLSSLGKNTLYKDIVKILSNYRFCTMDQLAQHLKIKKGGRFTELLYNLEQIGFTESYSRFDSGQKSKLLRITIKDYFLQFYSTFIFPKLKQIQNGDFQDRPLDALDVAKYRQWLGYAFERFARYNQKSIASALGFSGINYTAGTFFQRSDHEKLNGFQIDLLFDRDDGIITLCELKYRKTPIDREVIQQTEKKVKRLQTYTKKIIQPVLITTSSPTETLRNSAYFQHILQGDIFFE